MYKRLNLTKINPAKPAKIIKTPASHAFFENGPTRPNFYFRAHFAQPGTITSPKPLFGRDRPKLVILIDIAP